MPSEDEVNITRNKRLYQEIHGDNGKEHNDAGDQSGSGVGSRDVADRGAGHVETEGGNRKNVRRTPPGTGGATQANGATPGYEQGVRPVDRPGKHSTKGPADGNRRTQGLDEKNVVFNWRLPSFGKKGPKEPIRLFSETEAEESYDRMYEIYFQGSGLLDDVLEIIVKDHEPVTIWQLSPEEAENLATMHLSRARYDKKAAESARQLLALYDRLYMYILAVPRAKMTYEHIKTHGGLSFK